MSLDQTANNSVHPPAGKSYYAAIYSSVSVHMGSPHDNDLNEHKAVLFIAQSKNKFFLKKCYLIGLQVAKLFRILLLWNCLEVPVKFVLFMCKPR